MQDQIWACSDPLKPPGMATGSLRASSREVLESHLRWSVWQQQLLREQVDALHGTEESMQAWRLQANSQYAHIQELFVHPALQEVQLSHKPLVERAVTAAMRHVAEATQAAKDKVAATKREASGQLKKQESERILMAAHSVTEAAVEVHAGPQHVKCFRAILRVLQASMRRRRMPPV